ncbi:SSI family serine proteinase inhibitor [Phaeacidiphilus oryzae]|uniref:SSI family serine proteinase inhibitor n=1 Tax=Phaeacidiphilus oryzae TaxID=348818 RepID=UPI00068C3804|nr:SSI family serine proteinase inhibitor [Phaeacidiphilus oryzae]
MFMGNNSTTPPRHRAARAGSSARAGLGAAVAAAASAAALVAAAGTASAAVPGVIPAAPGASLQLTVVQQDGNAGPAVPGPGLANPGGPMRPSGGPLAEPASGPLDGGHRQSAVLDCFPPGGTHPHAAAACAELEAADGRFEQLHPAAGAHEMCPMLYSPVTVSATGDWRGAPVAYHHTYGNLCEAERATGDVFALSGEGADVHPDATV